MNDEMTTIKDNNELIKKFRETHDEKYFNELLKNNKSLILKLVTEHGYLYSKHFPIMDKEDIISIVNYTFYRAVKCFDVNKGFAFSTYFVKICRRDLGELYCHLKNREFATVSIEDKITTDDNSDISIGDLIPDKMFQNEFKNVEFKATEQKVFKQLYSILKPQEYYVLREIYQNGKKFEEIGLENNLSRQRIHQIYINAKNKIEKNKDKINDMLN